MTQPKHLVVSIHDVTPPELNRVARMLRRLADAGVTNCSLLVIPNLRGQWRMDRHPHFCDWLRERQDAGDEVVLHGYEHVGVGRPRTLWDRFRNRWYTQGEGEFLSLDYRQASDRIERGLALMLEARLSISGFVAPAWLINSDGMRAASDHGLQYTNSYLRLIDLPNGRSYFAPSLVFGPGHLNEGLGIALQRSLSSVLTQSRIVRVVLHPPCLGHPARFDRIIAMIRAQLREHHAVTYLQSLSALRAPLIVDARHHHAR